MSMQTENALGAYHWTPQPEAARIVSNLIEHFLASCPEAARLRDRMLHETGTRFADWVDHVQAPATQPLREALLAAGFVEEFSHHGEAHYRHPGGAFPAIVLHSQPVSRVAIKVDSVADFLAAQRMTPDQPIYGPPLSPLRKARAAALHEAELWVVERHGFTGFEPPPPAKRQRHDPLAPLRHLETFRRRPRDFARDEDGFAAAERLIDEATAELGADYAADLFFAAEREYWQRRNRAAQVQKARQDALGLGWANHDHHTYRSSRPHFVRLIGLLEKLGFQCRERFYAGQEAGWGAQVLEQPHAGIVIFADVDLSPDEVLGDFSHEGLAPRRELNTAGLWCALHGEAFLQPGMHHLECQFDFQTVREQTAMTAGLGVMKPFTDFAYLKQAFTLADRWPVREERLARLLAGGQITAEQAAQFRALGAPGSHLEHLQRDDGFKGFNQTGVSEIMWRTDPRHAGA